VGRRLLLDIKEGILFGYSSGLAISWTRKRVSGETPGLWFRARETVVIEAPLCLAISVILTLDFIHPQYFSSFSKY
jgi:hypothetical protein